MSRAICNKCHKESEDAAGCSHASCGGIFIGVKQSYRLDLNASICISVVARSEAEALKVANQAIEDFESGFELPDGDGYSDAVMYTSSEESAEVVDVEDIPAESESEMERRTR